MVGRLVSFWDGPFSGAMSVSGRVCFFFFDISSTEKKPAKVPSSCPSLQAESLQTSGDQWGGGGGCWLLVR